MPPLNVLHLVARAVGEADELERRRRWPRSRCRAGQAVERAEEAQVLARAAGPRRARGPAARGRCARLAGIGVAAQRPAGDERPRPRRAATSPQIIATVVRLAGAVGAEQPDELAGVDA